MNVLAKTYRDVYKISNMFDKFREVSIEENEKFEALRLDE